MNKQIKLLGITALVAVIVFSACQNDGGNFTYKGTTTITIIGYTGLKGVDIIIPAKINGKSVVSIGDSAFHNSELTGVTIPASVTTIGDWAFYGNQMTSVIIPGSVTFIGDRAFYGNKLTNVIIPDSVIAIRAGVFTSNPMLTAINVSVNNPNYSSTDGVLYNKDGSTMVQWPEGKTPVIIPNSVIVIGDHAFSGNKQTYVTIPDSVTVIGDNAFSFSHLTSVTIPNSVTYIGDGAFSNNELTSVTIPNSVTVIGNYAFYGNQLTSVTIPDSVIFIGEDAFGFDIVSMLTAINVSANNSNYRSVDGVLYNKNCSTLIRWPRWNINPVTIPNSVTYIGNYAFFCNYLASVTIPNSVTYIGNYAFSCNVLTSVTIPDSVIIIGDSAFSANLLSSVTIPDSVTNIGNSAFYGNQLTSVTIGANVTIGDYAFFDVWDHHSINNGFETAYNTTYGKTAGTYTRPNPDSTAWTKK